MKINEWHIDKGHDGRRHAFNVPPVVVNDDHEDGRGSGGGYRDDDGDGGNNIQRWKQLHLTAH